MCCCLHHASEFVDRGLSGLALEREFLSELASVVLALFFEGDEVVELDAAVTSDVVEREVAAV